MIRAVKIVHSSLTSIVLLGGCSSYHPAQDTARSFVDRFFVEANQHAALSMTEGPARAKVEEEIRLLADQPLSNAAERPRIFYRELSRTDENDGVTFHFRLTVVVIGDAPIEPELIVRVRPRAGAWRVSNYDVLPPADARSERRRSDGQWSPSV